MRISYGPQHRQHSGYCERTNDHSSIRARTQAPELQGTSQSKQEVSRPWQPVTKHWLATLMAKGLVPTRATTPQLRAGPVMSRPPRPSHLPPFCADPQGETHTLGGQGLLEIMVVVGQHRVCAINMKKGPKAATAPQGTAKP